VLIAHGADIRLATRDGATPLLAAAGHGYSRASGTEAFIKDRRDFSSYNSEPFAVATKIPAEEERLVIEALQVLLQAGADVNDTSAAGDTALHAASSLGMDAVIEFLAGRGANLNARNKAGRSPLDVARRDDGIGASVVREETVALLKKLGAG
jgi:ankyrin repeat protein